MTWKYGEIWDGDEPPTTEDFAIKDALFIVGDHDWRSSQESYFEDLERGETANTYALARLLGYLDDLENIHQVQRAITKIRAALGWCAPEEANQ